MGNLLTGQQKECLLDLARKTISVYLEKGETFEPEIDDRALREVMGVFVTLRKAGSLRGCIGSIVGTKPLYIGVRDMAIASAARDFRFPPVSYEELDRIDIEISLLSPLEKIFDPDKIILGTHGVLVSDAFQSGVFLPQVATETGWSKEEFMDNLCAQKAGMPVDAWRKGECEIYIFTAEVFAE